MVGMDKENIREFFIKEMDKRDPKMEFRVLTRISLHQDHAANLVIKQA
jgi:hypothetical protein